MTEAKIKITIVGDGDDRTCTGNCGVDWSSLDSLAAARQEISERFGNRAELEYISLLNAKDSGKIRHVKSLVQGMPLPVLLANGKPRIAGEFDTRQLMDVIEADLEAELR